MKPFSAFRTKGSWLKGNCHTHTTLSDGRSTREEIAAAYRKRGYDFLFLTDHRCAQPEMESLQRKNFVVIKGAELHPPTEAPNTAAHHVVALGVDTIPKEGSRAATDARTLMKWINRRGGISIYAHPYWTGHAPVNMEEGRAAFGVEVFNSTCHAGRGLGDASAHVDMMLTRGFRWRLFSVDDTHSLERDGFGGWINVKAKAHTEKAIMDAIKKGHFYASSGPEIHDTALRRNTISITTSPVRRITLHGKGSLGTTIIAKDKLLTNAEFKLTESHTYSPYLRLEIIDADGGKAWTQPIYRNKKGNCWEE
jgi:hypothetical protein